MSQHRFQSESFTATKWSNAEEKTKFANDLMACIRSGFPREKVQEGFLYDRLRHCFGMIAHYGRDGFFDTFFTRLAGEASLSQVPHPMALLRESRVHVQQRRRPQRPWQLIEGMGYVRKSTMPGYVASPRRAREPYWHFFRPSTTGQSVGCCKPDRRA